MRRFCFTLLLALMFFLPAQADEPTIEIDNSSYESLFKAASQIRQIESERVRIIGGVGLQLPNDRFWDTVVALDMLDLPFVEIFTHQEEVASPVRGQGHLIFSIPEDQVIPSDRRIAVMFAPGVAERLFYAGRIDDGVAFLTKLLPPRDETDGMLVTGFVSEALLEQQQFELAWQIAISGTDWQHTSRIAQYIERTIAKTRYEEQPSGYVSVRVSRSPFIPNEADAEVYWAEALRALDYLKVLVEQTDDENRRASLQSWLSNVMVSVGQYEEALALARHPTDIASRILRDRIAFGTQEEVDYWYQRLRQLHEGRTRTHDWSHPLISHSVAVGQYLEALDIFEHLLDTASRRRDVWSITWRHSLTIAEHNVETNFRYNSQEVLDRLVEIYDRAVADMGVGLINTFNLPDPYPFFSNVVKAQLNLDLVDDALVSFRKLDRFLAVREIRDTGNRFANVLSEFLVYSINLPPEEAGRVEARAVEVFRNSRELFYNDRIRRNDRRPVNVSFLIDAYTQAAIRLARAGNTDNHYLETAVQIAKEETLRQSEEADAPFYSNDLTKICERLIYGGFIDEALHIVDRFEGEFVLPVVHVLIAQHWATAGEADKAEQAIRQALETFAQVQVPLRWQECYGQIATIAVDLGNKELFYEILNTAMELTEKEAWIPARELTAGWFNNRRTPDGLPPNRVFSGGQVPDWFGSYSHWWNNPFGIFAHGLAIFGDGEHPFFAWAEEIADEGGRSGFSRVNLLASLGVSRAMLGDHENARRLLKKKMEPPPERRGEEVPSDVIFVIPSNRFRAQPNLIAILEAWSFERR